MKKTVSAVFAMCGLWTMPVVAEPVEGTASACSECAYDMEAELGTVLKVYESLNLLYSPCDYLTEDGKKNVIAEAAIRQAVTEIRPHVERLQQLSPAQVLQLCMLADAILWQQDWLHGMFLGELGWEMECSLEQGFERLVNLADYVQNRLSSPAVPAPEKAAWRELLLLLGGEQVLAQPHQQLEQRWAKDYKTALSFFKDLCTAVGTEDEAAALRLLAEQAEVMAYLEQGGKEEHIRVSYLLAAFCQSVSQFREHACMVAERRPASRVEESEPYVSPVFPQHLRTEARMKALQPFVETYPKLRELLDL